LETSPAYLQKAFIEALAEIPQRVLWKYDIPNIRDLPKNVKVGKWFPQRDILGKNLEIFFIIICNHYNRILNNKLCQIFFKMYLLHFINI